MVPVETTLNILQFIYQVYIYIIEAYKCRITICFSIKYEVLVYNLPISPKVAFKHSGPFGGKNV